MDKWQKETIQAQLNNEKAVLDALKESYEKALEDINRKTAELLGRSDAGLSNVIYQVQYQGALKAQIEGSLAVLQSENFNNVNEYLAKSYEEGFLGTIYNMQKQGIPLIMPIDQRQVVDAITKDTKLSSSLYTAMGKDITKLKKDISSEISRGISTGMTYSAIAKNVALRAGISQNNAKRIARTEGHRINTKATMDACEKAKEMGADVVKQWDATLDSKTRDSHRMVDGEIREIDEPFSNGLMYPSDPEGDAEETINCRCALLERARWAIDEDEAFTKAVEMDDGTQIVDFSNAKDYEEFKKDYWDAIDNPPEKLDEPLEKDGEGDKIELPKRKQLDTGYSGKVPDDKLEEFNQKALKQIVEDTGYSKEKAEELHSALLDYFGGDYETILDGETDKAKIIKEGISNMPAYDGSIYRGMLFDDDEVKAFSELKSGDELPQRGMIASWSSDAEVAQSFGGVNSYERNTVILECENNETGAGVQHISKFGAREAEVLTSANYEVVDVVIENKYDYLSQHKELLYFPDDLDWFGEDEKKEIICRIKVKEKKE